MYYPDSPKEHTRAKRNQLPSSASRSPLSYFPFRKSDTPASGTWS